MRTFQESRYFFQFLHSLVLTTFFTLSLTDLSYAVTASDVPPGSTAGGIESSFRQELDLIKRTTTAAQKPQPIIQKEPEEITETPEVAGRKFFVRKIKIKGNTLISTEELHRVVAPFEKQNLSLADMKGAAVSLKNLYRRRGYITSTAYLPVQRLDQGVVIIRVLEGKLGKVSVTGSRYFNPKNLKRQMSIDSGEVINYEQLELDLKRMNENPDKQVQLVLVPGLERQTTDVKLVVHDKFPFHASMDAKNEGSRLTGRTKYGATLRSSNTLYQDDTILIRPQFSHHSDAIGLNYVIPLPFDKSIDPLGTKFEFSFNHTNTRLSKEFALLNYQGKSWTYGGSLIQKMLLTPNYDVDWVTGFDYKKVVNRLLASRINFDGIRLIRSGLTLNEADSGGKTFMSTTMYWGIPDVFGGSKYRDVRSGRAQAGGRFYKTYSQFTRLSKMPYNTLLISQGAVQTTSATLVTGEQLQLGGGSTIRGYSESEYLGDLGYTLKFDYLIPAFFIPEQLKLPWSKTALKDDIQFVTFYDYGYAKLKKASSGEIKDKSLQSIGAGLRLRFYENTYMRFEWGFPMGDLRTDNGESEFHFGIQQEFL